MFSINFLKPVEHLKFRKTKIVYKQSNSNLCNTTFMLWLGVYILQTKNLNVTLALIQGGVCNITYFDVYNQQANEFGHLQFLFFIHFYNLNFISLSIFLIMHVDSETVVNYFFDSDLLIRKKVVITEATQCGFLLLVVYDIG